MNASVFMALLISFQLRYANHGSVIRYPASRGVAFTRP